MTTELNGVPVPDATLRKINHVEWLNDFSNVLGLQGPGSPPMTPMRQGAMSRLKLAAEYIRILERDNHWLSKDNIGMRRELEKFGVHRPPLNPEAEAVDVTKQEKVDGDEDFSGR